jgi:murein L,D-transpeptidase YcbB/YkuD
MVIKENRIKMNTRTRWAALLAMIALGLLAGCSQTAKSTDPRGGVASNPTSSSRALLSSEGQAWLRTTIGSGASDLRWPDFSDYSKHVKKFYESNGNYLWWVKDSEPTPQARQLIGLLLHADQKGLSAGDYDGPLWSDRLAGLKPATQKPEEANALKFDLALTVCAMRYISDLHIGKVNPKHLDFAFDQESKKYDLADFLRDRVVSAADVAGVLAQIEPQYPGYLRVMQALQTYTALAKTDDGELLPPLTKAIVPGDAYPGVPRLTGLLRLVGDLPADADVSPDGTIYDAALVDAVKKFQRRHGRDPNGRIGAQTLADLNVPLSRRVQQMQLALERWRWMPEAYQRAPIIVNIPEFRLRAYDTDFNVAVTMNVIVGSSFGHDTPVFADALAQVVFRPYWAVPLSIVRSELIPHILTDPNYLSKKGFEIVDSRQKVVGRGLAARDSVSQLRAGRLFIRQIPGPRNSLGLVLFLFPNSYSVYMHDTPAPEFFAKSRRDFSHGCIRLEKPAELAAWVLRDNPGWNPEHIHEAMNGSATQQVNLAHPIPVLIVYLTAVVLEDGLVHFFDDIYGHDVALQKALAKGYPYPE